MTRDPQHPIETRPASPCRLPICLAPPGVDVVVDDRTGLCPWCTAEVERIEADIEKQRMLLAEEPSRLQRLRRPG